jgi:two-component system response regulator HupR/HoxA
VRQLRNELKRAVALSQPGGLITPEMLSPDLATLTHEIAAPSGKPVFGRAPTAIRLADAVDQLERDMIRAALDRAEGNISETARQLGLTRRGLYLKLRRHGLDVSAEVDT